MKIKEEKKKKEINSIINKCNLKCIYGPAKEVMKRISEKVDPIKERELFEEIIHALWENYNLSFNVANELLEIEIEIIDIQNKNEIKKIILENTLLKKRIIELEKEIKILKPEKAES